MFGATSGLFYVPFKITTRIRPTALEQSGTAAHYQVLNAAATSNLAFSAVPSYSDNTTTEQAAVNITVASGLVAGNAGQVSTANSAAYLAWSAEL